MNWYVEIQANGTPFTPCKAAVQFEAHPVGYWCGPFHCPDCANTVVSFGKSEQDAWLFSHGTDDEKFCVFLSE